MPNNPGTLVTEPVRPWNAADTYPVAYANEIAGGHHQVATLAARDAIPADRLVDGMLVSVLSQGITWQRRSGAWVEFSRGTAAFTYRHTQSIAAATWTIPHELGRRPGGITVQDFSGNTLRGAVSYPDDNSVVLTFSTAVAGLAVLS